MSVKVGVWCLGLLVLVAGSSLQRDFPDYSAELVKKINAMDTTWKAGPNFAGETAKSVLERLRTNGQPRNDAPIDGHVQKSPIRSSVSAGFPDEFDSRIEWPRCNISIGHVFSEGRCNAGWAISVIGAIRDRYCIRNDDKRFNFSVEDALTCLNGSPPSNGCNRKNIYAHTSSYVWAYWVSNGFVSGGDWNSTSGCKPYPYSPCDHYHDYDSGAIGPCQSPPPDTTCSETCRLGYPGKYTDDKKKGSYSWKIDATEQAVQKEIYFYGPVSAQIALFGDFLIYSSGVYQQTTNQWLGWHGVKIIGWGVEKKTPYWLCVNSWNDQWGEKGFVKIRRGTNEIQIETNVYSGQP